MIAPMRSPLTRVECISTTAVPLALSYSLTSGFSRAAATRGSALTIGICSLVISSDCTAIRAEVSSGSTS